MKEITRYVQTSHKEYEAYDGTVFADQQQCKEYEESASGVLLKRLSEKALTCRSEASLMDDCDEHQHICVPVKDKDTVDLINHLYGIGGREPQLDDSAIGQILIVSYRMCCNNLDCIWTNNLQSMVESATGSLYTVGSKDESSFNSFVKTGEIKLKEQQDLIKVIKQNFTPHNGIYTVDRFDPCPHIAAYFQESPADVVVDSVSVDKYDRLKLKVHRLGETYSEVIAPANVFASFLSLVTDVIKHNLNEENKIQEDKGSSGQSDTASE